MVKQTGPKLIPNCHCCQHRQSLKIAQSFTSRRHLLLDLSSEIAAISLGLGCFPQTTQLPEKKPSPKKTKSEKQPQGWSKILRRCQQQRRAWAIQNRNLTTFRQRLQPPWPLQLAIDLEPLSTSSRLRWSLDSPISSAVIA